MSRPIVSPDGKKIWDGNQWVPLVSETGPSNNVNIQDSVVTGDVNVQMNNIDDITQAVGVAINNLRQNVNQVIVPAAQSPRKQVWFFGKRIWSPKGHFLLLSLFLGIISLVSMNPLLAILGALIAIFCVKYGDIRGIPVLLFNAIIALIFV